MLEIWQECANSLTTSPRIADQVRTIKKKGLFSDLEILDIYQKTMTQDNNAVADISRVVKQNQPDRKKSTFLQK